MVDSVPITAHVKRSVDWLSECVQLVGQSCNRYDFVFFKWNQLIPQTLEYCGRRNNNKNCDSYREDFIGMWFCFQNYYLALRVAHPSNRHPDNGEAYIHRIYDADLSPEIDFHEWANDLAENFLMPSWPVKTYPIIIFQTFFEVQENVRLRQLHREKTEKKYWTISLIASISHHHTSCLLFHILYHIQDTQNTTHNTAAKQNGT